MSLQPIYGYSGNNPVLTFAGDFPVSMEVTGPTVGSNSVVTAPTRCTIASTATTATATCTATGNTTFAGAIDVFLVYTGLTTINLTLTASANVTAANANGGIRVNGLGYYGTFSVTLPTPATDSMTVPYYRYRLRFSIGGKGTALTTSDYVTLTWSFS